MEEKEVLVKSPVRYLIIKLIVSVVLAVFIFVFKEDAIENLRSFICTLMIMYGLDAILFDLLFNRKHFFQQGKNYLGFIEIILGITLLIFVIPFQSVCVVWATWSIVRESYEIKEIVNDIHNIPLTIISGLETITVIVMSVMLIVEATERHALIHCYLLMIELVLTPLVPLLNEIMKKKKKEESE